MSRDYGVVRHVGGFDVPPSCIVDVVCGVPVVTQLLHSYLDTVPMPYATVSSTVLIDLPVGFAFRVLPALQQQGAPVVVATHNHCPEYLEDLWACDPTILLAYVDLLHELVFAIERAARGDRYRLTSGQPSCLTSRERALLHKVAHGWSAKQIATAYGLQPKTVSNQITAMCEKLYLRDRVAATLYYWGQADLFT